MNRYRSGFVLGYHGCDEAICEAVLNGATMRPSTKDYDWLGPGVYFWEGDPDRAHEWAEDRVRQGHYKKPAVVGAVIELGNCLDLTLRSHLGLLSAAYQSLKSAFDAAGKPLPKNRGGSADKALRYLDCAVIQHLNDNLEAEAEERRGSGQPIDIAPFDTVRGLFTEGGPLYENGGFYTHTHSQIAVRNQASIRGCFRPR